MSLIQSKLSFLKSPSLLLHNMIVFQSIHDQILHVSHRLVPPMLKAGVWCSPRDKDLKDTPRKKRMTAIETLSKMKEAEGQTQ
mmetsp:Transcript_20975/g.34609  ORF Transcript_20975/g.34609 Transcript_20975/m.34609 type:complete len:83 (+) Transcript_20975:58-306(+)